MSERSQAWMMVGSAALAALCVTSCTEAQRSALRGSPSPSSSPPSSSVDEPLRVTAVALTVDPREYKGPCPALFTFRGTVTVEGGPGEITYKWLRSDGATAPVEKLKLAVPGPKLIESRWDLGTQPERPFEAWQRLLVLTPQRLESKSAGFAMTCE